MTAFAIYRMPYRHHCTLVVQQEGEPEELSSLTQLNGREGYVVAPFAPSEECPILLMQPDALRHLPVMTVENDTEEEDSPVRLNADDERKYYEADFRCFQQALEKGEFAKLVLARRMQTKWGRAGRMGVEQLFMRICRRYPRLYVALVSTARSGTWLMATPEILLAGQNGEFTTMALAGTQEAPPSKTVADCPVEGVEWSQKNRNEQQCVADYIARAISRFSADCTQKGPFTTMAANLYHLRTDFQFRLSDTGRLGDVLDTLFPTPAVCGMPKEEARQFILDHESIDRKYYSGFVGMISPVEATHLYVSLRCVNLQPGGICTFYGGGGLLKESELESEWEETEAKIRTLVNT